MLNSRIEADTWQQTSNSLGSHLVKIGAFLSWENLHLLPYAHVPFARNWMHPADDRLCLPPCFMSDDWLDIERAFPYRRTPSSDPCEYDCAWYWWWRGVPSVALSACPPPNSVGLDSGTATLAAPMTATAT